MIVDPKRQVRAALARIGWVIGGSDGGFGR
jgi:hypothetical protein